MLKSLFAHKSKVALVLMLVFFLAAIRAFEDVLFYDPFLEYFKSDFTAMPLPEIDLLKLSLFLFLRYTINTVFSLAIIYIIFDSIELTKFASALYIIFFIVLMMLFYVAIAYDSENKMILFYIRRFLIQPLFLLLFIPAFYFQERVTKKNNVS